MSLRPRIWLIPALLAAQVVAARGSSSHAPAGTIIRNIASVTFTDGGGIARSVESNAVETPVAADGPGVDGTLAQQPEIIAGESVRILLMDADFNLSPEMIDTVSVLTVNERTGERERTTLRETGPNTGEFAGVLPTWYGTSAGPDGDGTLVAMPGDVLASMYSDARTVSGKPVERSAQTTVLPTWIALTPEPTVIVANGTDRSILTARVTDDHGRPLPDGIMIEFTADKGTFENGTQRTLAPISGGNGVAVVNFIAPILAWSDTARVVASFRGFDSDELGLEVLPGAVGVRVYDQLRNIEVRADDPELRVEVTLHGTTVTGEPIVVTVTLDENGLFVVPDIPPGNYQLKVQVFETLTGRLISDGALQSISVQPDGSTTPVRNSISGEVRGRGDTSGARYAGAKIELLDASGNVVASAYLDAYGRYDFQGLDPGDYSLRITLADGMAIVFSVSPRTRVMGAAVVNAFVLIDPFGRTFDASSKDAIPDVMVALRTLDGVVLAIPGLNGTGAMPNGDNANPFVTTSDGRYAFLFGGNQVGTTANPARYVMTVNPPAPSGKPGRAAVSFYPPRRMYLTVSPINDSGAPGTPITMSVTSADGLPLAAPNSFSLTDGPIVVPDIQTIAFNIPLFPNAPVIRFTKTALADTVNYGDAVDFRLVVANIGNDVAPAVTVVDTLNADWTLVGSDAASVTGDILRWSLGDMRPGDADTLRIRARANAEGVDLGNRAWVESTGHLPVSADATVNSRSAAGIRVAKTADRTTAEPGERVTYTITIRRPADYAGTIGVRDPLPAELAYAAGSSNPVAAYDSAAHTLSWTISAGTDSVRTLSFAVEPRAGFPPGEALARNIAIASVGAYTVPSNPVDVIVSVPFFAIEKTTDVLAAETGDFVVYRIAIRNLSADDSLTAVTMRDVIPVGFGYVGGSARLDGVAHPPDSAREREIVWTIGGVGAGDTRPLTYRLVLGMGAAAGDGTNVATATAKTPAGLTLAAGPVRATVQARPSPFSLDEIILGRAWVDTNGNGVHDGGEPPVPGIVLVMEDGTRIIADRFGRFSIPEARPGDHVLRLMPQNIPADLEPAPLGVRSADDPWIRFVDVSPSGMAKANFPFRAKPLPPPPVVELPPPPPPPPPPPSVPDTAIVAVWVERGVLSDSIITLPPRETLILESSLNFDTGKDILKPAGIAKLGTFLPKMQQAAAFKINVSGHTDSRPIHTRQFPDNYALSMGRARAIKLWATSVGLDTTNIVIEGFGPDRPVATNRTDEGRAANRRVEIYLEYQNPPAPLVIHHSRISFALGTSDTTDTAACHVSQELPAGFASLALDSLRNMSMQPGDARVFAVRERAENFANLPAPTVVHPVHGALTFGQAAKDLASTDTERWTAEIRIVLPLDSASAAIPAGPGIRVVPGVPVVPVGPDKRSDAPAIPGGTTTVTTSQTAPAVATAESAPQVVSRGPVTVTATAAVDTPASPVAERAVARRIPAPRRRVARPGQIVWIESPMDSTVSFRDRLTVIARGQAGLPMVLTVNGRAAATLTVRADAKADFLNIAAPAGPVVLGIRQVQRNGAVATDSVYAHVIGPATRVMADVVPTTLPADSVSQADVVVQVLDYWGMPLRDGEIVTFEIDNGTILATDLYPEEAGVQVQVRAGMASARVLAPGKVGEGRLRASAAGVTAEATLNYTTPFERAMVVGMAAGQFGWRRNRAAPAGVNAGGDFEKGAYANGKAAVFARGTIGDGYLLTTSYDSDRRFNDRVFRYLTPERGFPIHGDASSVFYEAPSASRFFFRVEKDRRWLQYGDFATNLSQTELSAYNRTFTGVAASMRGAHTSWTAFGAFTEQSIQVDEIPGEGISGLYYLAAARRSNTRVVEGSERIVLQTRDRLHPEHIVREEPQYRFTDYEIDYRTGTLLFKRPVPSRGPDENPVIIVATYEIAGSLDRNAVGGGRLAVRGSERWEVGLSVVGEERAARDYWLTGLDARVRPFENVVLSAEVARSAEADTGWAWKIGAQGRYRSLLDYDLSWRQADSAFGNPGATTALRGVKTARGRIGLSPLGTVRITGEAFHSDDAVNDEARTSGTLGGSYRWRALTALTSLEMTNAERTGTKTESAILHAGLEWAAARQLTLRAERDQNFGDEEAAYRPTLNRISARWSPTERVDVVVEHAFRDYNVIDSSYTALAIQSRVSDDLTAYANYKLDGGINGQTNEAIVGLRHRYRVRPDLTLHTSFERMQTLRGNRAGDFYAWSLAAQYLPPEWMKASARFEKRDGRSYDKTLVSAAADFVVARDLSLLAKHTWLDEGHATGSPNAYIRGHHFLSGLAWRASANDRLNVLGKYELKTQYNGMIAPITERTTHIGSVEAVVEPWSQIEAFARYAFKVSRLTSEGLTSRTLTDLWMTNVRYEWRRTWDVLAEYRLLTQHTVGDRNQGIAGEVGRVLNRNARVAIGYNFAGYNDEDFSGINYWGQGPYLKIQVKFIESDVAGALNGLQSFWRER